MNNRIRLNAFRSLNKSWKPSSASSLLHTSRSSLNADDESRKNADSSTSSNQASSTDKETTNTLTASERKKQLLKKLGKIDFITLKTPDAPTPPKPSPIKLKPQVDYQSFIKSKSQGRAASQTTSTASQPARDSSKFVRKPIKVEMDSRFERKNLVNRRDETTKYSSKPPSNDQEMALKLASLIDKTNPQETAKLLLDPLYKKEYDQEKEAKKKAAVQNNSNELRLIYLNLIFCVFGL